VNYSAARYHAPIHRRRSFSLGFRARLALTDVALFVVVLIVAMIVGVAFA